MTVFEQGEIVCLDFDPQSGDGQRGHHPALVVRSGLLNRVSGLTMVCPITNTARDHPFHVRLDGTTKTTGVVMCDLARMLDLGRRRAAFEEKAPASVTAEAADLIMGFIEHGQK